VCELHADADASCNVKIIQFEVAEPMHQELAVLSNVAFSGIFEDAGASDDVSHNLELLSDPRGGLPMGPLPPNKLLDQPIEKLRLCTSCHKKHPETHFDRKSTCIVCLEQRKVRKRARAAAPTVAEVKQGVPVVPQKCHSCHRMLPGENFTDGKSVFKTCTTCLETRRSKRQKVIAREGEQDGLHEQEVGSSSSESDTHIDVTHHVGVGVLDARQTSGRLTATVEPGAAEVPELERMESWRSEELEDLLLDLELVDWLSGCKDTFSGLRMEGTGGSGTSSGSGLGSSAGYSVCTSSAQLMLKTSMFTLIAGVLAGQNGWFLLAVLHWLTTQVIRTGRTGLDFDAEFSIIFIGFAVAYAILILLSWLGIGLFVVLLCRHKHLPPVPVCCCIWTRDGMARLCPFWFLSSIGNLAASLHSIMKIVDVTLKDRMWTVVPHLKYYKYTACFLHLCFLVLSTGVAVYLRKLCVICVAAQDHDEDAWNGHGQDPETMDCEGQDGSALDPGFFLHPSTSTGDALRGPSLGGKRQA